ncbi:hypothetical protein Zmor_026754 [Zophobas morio]|uniref:Uncharacterized protein n=1 Tax=Zophobas morio TaxID=2755281 RepID=A0AA38HW98_9CUCU|nr:hypothetical protein Zmor_026754 [Zophobas morio]
MFGWGLPVRDDFLSTHYQLSLLLTPLSAGARWGVIAPSRTNNRYAPNEYEYDKDEDGSVEKVINNWLETGPDQQVAHSGWIEGNVNDGSEKEIFY